jgi:hypothetical protein
MNEIPSTTKQPSGVKTVLSENIIWRLERVTLS